MTAREKRKIGNSLLPGDAEPDCLKSARNEDREIEHAVRSDVLVVVARNVSRRGGMHGSEESVPAYQYGTSAPADDGAEVHLVRPYSPETHFKGLDRDGDGVLSLSEFLAERQGAEAIRKGTDVFAILDQDHNGKLTLAEFTNRPPRAQFRELDDDGDGYLNFKEFWRGTMSSASQKQVERTFRGARQGS